MTKISTLLAIMFVVLLPHLAQSEVMVERPCSKADLIGMWTISSAKSRGSVGPSYQDLLLPFQVRVYEVNDSFKQLTSNKKLESNVVNTLFSTAQLKEKFHVENGFVVTVGEDGEVLDQYECSFFFGEYPEANIKPDTLSLLWLKDGEPYILNTYVRFDTVE